MITYPITTHNRMILAYAFNGLLDQSAHRIAAGLPGDISSLAQMESQLVWVTGVTLSADDPPFGPMPLISDTRNQAP